MKKEKYGFKTMPKTDWIAERKKWAGKVKQNIDKVRGGKVSYNEHEHHHNGKCKHGKYGNFDYPMGNPFEIKGNMFSKEMGAK
jgi:hypothetical protein